MDLKTLWDRTNDAINTIIRRDESSETGDFLQPCIEAALNLGCTLRRSSRSQRNCHPRCYLSPNTTDFDNAAKTPNSGSIRRSPLPQNTNKTAMKRVSVPENVKPPNPEKLSVNSFSAYPLYYGSVAQIEPLCGKGIFAPNPPCLEDSRGSCDLSLRLGQSIPVLDKGFSLFPRSNAFEPLGSQKGLKPGEASVRKRKVGFDFDRSVTMEDQRFCLKPKLPFRNPKGS